MHAYLLQIHKELLPKSEAGQTVNYLLKNWTALTRYCENPALSIDNNHTASTQSLSRSMPANAVTTTSAAI